MDFNENILLMTDSYKVTHWLQYPPGTERVYSYFEAREPAKDFLNIVFFGLQYYLMKYFAGQVVTKEKIDEAEEICKAHFMNPNLFNRAAWEYILDKHEGRLPISIKAVPEGTVVPRSNVLCTVENTDPKCYWLTNYLETLLVQLWYPCTVATLSREIKMVILNAIEATGGNPDEVDFKLHDFGFRGVSSVETAAIGDCAHLVNFKGTDTMAGLTFARKYYDCEMGGFSIPASEHSTMTAWGQEHEKEAYENMLEKYPQGLVSVVSDSWDIGNAISNIWGEQLKEKVLNRNGILVIRPDSGDPVMSAMQAIQKVAAKFGSTKNEAGFSVLNPKIRIIQGDGVDLKMIERIYRHMEGGGWCADNIVFGCGGSLLQKLNRDTCRFAFKCASVTINGQERDVWKNPKSDRTKTSKAGRMKLTWCDEAETYKTVRENEEGDDLLMEVFRNGEVTKHWTLEEIRSRAFVD